MNFDILSATNAIWLMWSFAFCEYTVAITIIFFFFDFFNFSTRLTYILIQSSFTNSLTSDNLLNGIHSVVSLYAKVLSWKCFHKIINITWQVAFFIRVDFIQCAHFLYSDFLYKKFRFHEMGLQTLPFHFPI